MVSETGFSTHAHTHLKFNLQMFPMASGFQEQRKERFQKIQDILEEEDYPDLTSAVNLISVETGLGIEKAEEHLQTLSKAGKIPEKYQKTTEGMVTKP